MKPASKDTTFSGQAKKINELTTNRFVTGAITQKQNVIRMKNFKRKLKPMKDRKLIYQNENRTEKEKVATKIAK